MPSSPNGSNASVPGSGTLAPGMTSTFNESFAQLMVQCTPKSSAPQ